jgi:hypothetical protein
MKKGAQSVKEIAEVIGRELKWMQPSAWKMEYELRSGDETIATLRFRSSFGSFATAENAELVRFKTGGLVHLSATIEILPGAPGVPELPCLVMLGWYLAVMMHMDSAVTVAAIS